RAFRARCPFTQSPGDTSPEPKRPDTMSVVGHQPPPFFKRGLPASARLTLYVVLSLGLLVADLRFRYLETVRHGMTVLTYPLQIAASTPAEWANRTFEYFSSLTRLQSENQTLRAKALNDAKSLLRQQSLEKENRQLRETLGMRERVAARSIAAEVIYAARDPFARRVIIDRGERDGVEPGLAAIDAAGVIGQVTRVFPLQAEITLLTDKDQAIPVKVVRTGQRAVMFGAGSGLLELRYLAANADVAPGDVIVTSGLDGVYLPDLPVARVLKVSRDDARGFARFICQPVAGVERSGAVLVLGRSVTPLPDPTVNEPAPADPATGSRQKKR
ncbi:rod shape-determining protein MreC, partial [Niveibacterium sp. 24ML]|uniref:rod shape-determining protein MreC n=1 Tax=Niveibacterium sp. 24ML TaxID=2985512 RepID=UPI0022705A5D